MTHDLVRNLRNSEDDQPVQLLNFDQAKAGVASKLLNIKLKNVRTNHPYFVLKYYNYTSKQV